MDLTSIAKRLTFRPLVYLTDDDMARVRDIRNQPAVRANMYTSQIISETEHLAWAERAKHDPELAFFGVFERDKLIGASIFRAISSANRRADWAFYLSSDAQGVGIGAGLEFASLDLAFGALDLKKLNGEVLSFNAPVLKLHKRFGFVAEGVRRCHILRDGKWFDVHLLGITKQEWHVSRAALCARRIT